LSIDLDLQKTAEKSLEKTLTELRKGGIYESPWGNFQFGISRSEGRPYINAKSGAVVAVDVKTGQVLASASYPSYDPIYFLQEYLVQIGKVYFQKMKKILWHLDHCLIQ